MKKHLGPILMLGVAFFIVGGCIHSIVRGPDKKPDNGEQSPEGEERSAKRPVKESPEVRRPQAKEPTPTWPVEEPLVIPLPPKPPDKAFLFQPRFTYADTTTYQGTGFFVRAPNGWIAAVTSAHFLRRDGAPLLKAEWMDLQADKTVALFSKSWGQPGSGVNIFSSRSDYLLMPVERKIPREMILELDSRPIPEKGERVWFPNKDPTHEIGYELVAGTVTDPFTSGPLIVLDKPVRLQSQSGSPVISQTNGKVLGTLSLGNLSEGKTTLVLCPASAIVEALGKDKEFLPLRTLVGKEGHSEKGREGGAAVEAEEPKALALQMLGLQMTHGSPVYSLTFYPDGKTLASGGRQTITLWDVQTRKVRASLKGHTMQVWSLASSLDGKMLASGSWDRTIKLWDAVTTQELRTLKGHTDRVYSIAFSPDGKTLASGSADWTIKLWDVETGKVRVSLKGHESVVWSVAFSPNGKFLASGSEDNTIKLWDVQTGNVHATLQGHRYLVDSVAFNPDGKILASGSADGTIRLWDVQTGKEQASFKGHTGRVRSIRLSPDGKTLASGSGDDTIRLWDVQTGNEQARVKGHTSEVLSVTFSPDGKTLASGGGDKTIKLWAVPSQK